MSTRAQAPGRVNLIGEHVDYQAGLCLPIALRQRTVAEVELRDDDVIEARSGERRWSGRVADLVPGAVAGWPAYVAGVLWALGVTRGLEIHLASDVPVGAGLSSSAALTCSVALAVSTALDLGLTGAELIDPTIRAEGDFAGAPTGGLDQTASLLCTAGNALLVDFADSCTEQIPFAPPGLTLLVVDTKVSHAHTAGGYGQRRAECAEAARLLGVPDLRHAPDPLPPLPDPLDRRVRHVVTEIARVRQFADAARSGRWDDAGRLMGASHASLRDDYEVSCPELDATVEAAYAAGAIGARMTGGGFGGSAIALVPDPLVADVRAAVDRAFAGNRWVDPAYLLAEAGPGAQVLD